jgi:hypothetical protein
MPPLSVKGTNPANLCPIWRGGGESFKGQARLILHNEYEGRKRFLQSLATHF